jgi:hypothetical protein
MRGGTMIVLGAVMLGIGVFSLGVQAGRWAERREAR